MRPSDFKAEGCGGKGELLKHSVVDIGVVVYVYHIYYMGKSGYMARLIGVGRCNIVCVVRGLRLRESEKLLLSNEAII